MIGLENLLTQRQVHALGWTLVHFLWEGAVAALAMAACNLSLRRSPARVRYAMSCAFLLVMLALPVATFFVTLNYSAAGSLNAGGAEATWFAAAPSPSVAVTEANAPQFGLSEALEPLLPWLVAFWMSGVALLSIHWLAAWAYVYRLRRAVSLPVPPEWARALGNLKERLSLSTPARLCVHALSHTPSVIGWVRPAILMPAAAVAGLDARAIEAVLAHELAHIRRHDYLVNLLQTSVETLLFYHPAVWWVSNRIRVERENCCDDLAAGACGDRVVYARALVDLEQIRSTQMAFAMSANGGSLIERVRRLLGVSETGKRHAPAWLPALAGLAIVAFVLASARPGQRAFSVTAPQTAPSAEQAQGQSPSPAPAPAPAAKPLRPTPRVTAPESETAPSPDEAADDTDTKEDFIAGMADAGYRNLTVDQLIQLRNHGVTPQFAREVKAAGYADVKPEKLMELRIHGVDSSFIQGMKANGFQNLSLDELTALRIHGVDPEFIAEIKNAGYSGLSAEQYQQLRIHGVDGEFVQGLKSAGFAKLKLEELLSLRIHGVDPEFIAEMKKAGYGGLSAEQYQELRIHGVDGEYVQGLKSAGFANLKLEALLSLRIHGVDPEFIAEMKSAGYGGLTAEQYKQFRIFGVDADFVRHLREHGINNASAEQLIRLKQAGI